MKVFAKVFSLLRYLTVPDDVERLFEAIDGFADALSLQSVWDASADVEADNRAYIAAIIRRLKLEVANNRVGNNIFSNLFCLLLLQLFTSLTRQDIL